MSTSYILDAEHLVSEINIRQPVQQINVVRHLEHWYRGLIANGILVSQNGWLNPISQPHASKEFSAACQMVVAYSIENGVKLTDQQMRRIKVDCMIGAGGNLFSPWAKTSVPLMEYLSSTSEKAREDGLLMKSFSAGKEADFRKYIQNITKYSKCVEFYEPIWGREAGDGSKRAKYAKGLAYIMEAIIDGTAWADEIHFMYYTERCTDLCSDVVSNPSEETRCKLIQSLTDAGRYIRNRSIGDPDIFIKNKCSIKLWPNTYFMHDRFLMTDQHLFSFGRGFDVIEESRGPMVDWKLGDISIYYGGDRKRQGSFIESKKAHAV